MESCECGNLNSAYKDHQRPFHSTTSAQYLTLCRALHDATREMHHSLIPTVSPMVLELFYATCVLSTIARLFEGMGSLIQMSDLEPMLLYFEARQITLNELCDDVYRSNLPEYLGQSPVRNTDVAADLYRKSIFDAAKWLSISGSGSKIAQKIGWIACMIGMW